MLMLTVLMVIIGLSPISVMSLVLCCETISFIWVGFRLLHHVQLLPCGYCPALARCAGRGGAVSARPSYSMCSLIELLTCYSVPHLLPVLAARPDDAFSV